MSAERVCPGWAPFSDPSNGGTAVTEIPSDATFTPEEGTDDWADPSELPLEDVQEVFATLAKALRAYQLYDSRNPVYQRFVAALGEALSRVWRSRDRLQVLVEEERLTWLGEEVYRNEDRSESLAFVLYRDGIRDLTLKEGLERTELEGFLDALHRARRTAREGDDLVTILWDLDLEFLGYTALDIGVDGLALPSGLAPGGVDVEGVLRGELGEATGIEVESSDTVEDSERAAGSEGEAATPGIVKKEDFNPTLYALDPGEVRRLAEELEREMARDLRTAVLNALFDRLEEPERPERQVEILGILRVLLPNLLSRGALGSAGKIVGELQRMRDRTGVFDAEIEPLAASVLEELSEPESVRELVRALEDGSVPPNPEELENLLQSMRPSALAPLLAASEWTGDQGVRRLLLSSVQRLAEGNRGLLVELLGSEDSRVACGAVRLVGRMGLTEASGSLARLLDEGGPEIRRAVVDAAGQIQSSVLAGALQRLLRDSDRELRIAAARALGAMRYGRAAVDFEKILGSKELRQADVTEKVAFFEAYGRLAGAGAVPFLAATLNRRGFLGRRDPSDLRAGAALALGKIGTPEARSVLEQARNEDDPVVRSAVVRALRGEGEPPNE